MGITKVKEVKQESVSHLHLKNDSIWREDLNTTILGQAVITKVLPGNNMSFTSTGVEEGTGEVTLHANATISSVDEKVKTSSTDTQSGYLLDKIEGSANIILTETTSTPKKVKFELAPQNSSVRYISQLFSREGKVKSGKWLKIDGISTDKVPFIIPFDGTIIKLILQNKEINSGTLELFKNKSTLGVISLQNKVSINQVCSYPVLENDEISVKGISGEIKDVLLTLILSI